MFQNPRFAIINADDFGFSDRVNQAIIQAHEKGILTSTSLMVTGEKAPDAVEKAKTHPNLAVGLHLVLVCGRSALPPKEIPHLVDKEGNFSNDSVKAGLKYQFNSAARQELHREIRAQLEKFRSTGLPLSHVDGHLHMHSHPVVLNILAEFANEFDIKFIRLPSEELSFTLKLNRSGLVNKLIWSTVFHQLRKYGESVLKSRDINFVERVYGLLQTGSITEEYLLGLIPQIQANLVEIYCHPDTDAGATELAALLSQSVRQVLGENNFEMTNYSQLSLSSKDS
ncbi:MAG: hopanoid biosynthesis-associated protein HpnK [Cyanomargarita calcarea GSE-NOS-MK-12-04C]|jgi:hopanoid biosynthesis associated protein HpnK|uniref:Hopanoid biosynthesis-associated protein HpnK n=1 Tax=Cyanomargarita calcarea GSE-NOS-MK-12-04C TaxID=2839659 RepID=A0A951UT73_9CYAN|nr:hopanoid biosynthesis-associated protein HpnK [Cyanomargarita calcarea GSE-NOS-MK-12-04C]